MQILVAGMPYTVAHEMRGRVRLRPRNPKARARAREAFTNLLAPLNEKIDITLSEITGSVLLTYNGAGELRSPLRALLGLPEQPSVARPRAAARVVSESAPLPVGPPAVVNPVPAKLISLVFPRVINVAVAIFRAIPYIFRGLRELVGGRLGLNTLDAAALMVCILRRDFRALSSITFFFSLGAFLEYWTRKKSHGDLAKSLALNITHVWVKDGELEREVPMADLRAGEVVVVRAGSVIPVDGTVVGGEAMVNQAGMTGEPLPVRRDLGSSVYAGTVVEEGELHISVTKVGGETRIDSILRYIENSESVKAGIQSKYERIADGIVPYNFLLAFIIYLITRDTMRTGAVLLVDYSCAIRLATPLTVLSAMSEAARRGTLIKGGRFLEALAEADTIVFDKTGTLTAAAPEVVEVIPFGDYDADKVLRLAACLEEHFPHPVGQSVVRAAEQKNLKHREEHAKVEFVVAHGIATKLRGERVLIGSEHFIIEDAGIALTRQQKATVKKQAEKGRSLLFLAVGEEVAGIIAIEDLLRPGMPEFIADLRGLGFKRIIMLTGDGEKTAAAIARKAGITEFKARLLPEDKARFIADLKARGARVLMMGDGVNDAPALSAADVGAALTHGADMAKEVADIVLTRGEPADIIRAREVALAALRRIRSHFFAAVGLNSVFLAGALSGLLTPGISAFLHNACTAALAVRSMGPLLPDEDGAESIEEEI